MITGIIAECGNHHFGELAKAKEQIRIAQACGARYAKLQAIDPETFTGGSMPPEFYRQCDLGMDGYLECVAYGKELGIEVFFSIFGPKYHNLRMSVWPYKISGGQFKSFRTEELGFWNSQGIKPVIVSIPDVGTDFLAERAPLISRMHAMYVTGYLEAPSFAVLERHRGVLGRPVGYSDHTPGIEACQVAIHQEGCRLIEKHFNLWGEQSFNGQIYRDSLHAASAQELERLVTTLHRAS